MRSILATLFLIIVAFPVQAGIFGNRRCNTCYQPVYYYQPQNLVIVDEKIIVPTRVVRFAEVPNLQIVTDNYGKELLVIDGKIRDDLNKPKFVKEEVVDEGIKEIKKVTEIDNFGTKIRITETQVKGVK